MACRSLRRCIEGPWHAKSLGYLASQSSGSSCGSQVKVSLHIVLDVQNFEIFYEGFSVFEFSVFEF